MSFLFLLFEFGVFIILKDYDSYLFCHWGYKYSQTDYKKASSRQSTASQKWFRKVNTVFPELEHLFHCKDDSLSFYCFTARASLVSIINIILSHLIFRTTYANKHGR